MQVMVVEAPSGRVLLSHHREQWIPSGHPWVYAGDIEEITGDPAPGDLVDLRGHSGRFCGRGFYNPESKIRVRILTFRDEPITESFWGERLERAAALRRRVVSNTTAYRLVHGESDLLPGLIADRYGDVLVLQTLSFGMDRRKELIAELLSGQTGAKAVYLRNDTKSRRLEGLQVYRGFLRGTYPTQVDINEGPAHFRVDVERGQKTGWFCDQRENRLAVASLAGGAEVLEVFCHTGAFGVQAALCGAASVLGLDMSVEAIALARDHATMNGVGAICQFREADAFEELRKLERRGQRYDLVILDPPAFARRKQDLSQALAGYKEINRLALRLVRPDEFLVSCSCSYHVSEPSLWRTVLEAARDAKRQLRLVESRSQGRDHPMLAAMPETRYLKCLILQVF
jgi:23S rRNA (cytosine1962-C5)-methyltransferase